ncbi:hypothetical protein M8J77_001019 [Diaphorina citri]|nr:hypothetical protein M8J77_001019 [Diaphorina citri]
MIATGGTKWAVPQPPPPLSGPRTPVESFLRAFKRRSLRVKRSKSLVITEKRKSEVTEFDFLSRQNLSFVCRYFNGNTLWSRVDPVVPYPVCAEN